MSQHDMFLWVDNSSEIVLECSCGWQRGLGDNPTPEEVIYIGAVHRGASLADGYPSVTDEPSP